MSSLKVLLKFSSNDINKPITYHISRDYDLVFSILQADIDAGRGRIIMDLSGEEENLQKALDFARSENVRVSVLSKAVVRDEALCVHCGACTAVCTHKALVLDPVTAELSFDNANCVVCEMCTHACPTGAIKVDLFE